MSIRKSVKIEQVDNGYIVRTETQEYFFGESQWKVQSREERVYDWLPTLLTDLEKYLKCED